MKIANSICPTMGKCWHRSLPIILILFPLYAGCCLSPTNFGYRLPSNSDLRVDGVYIYRGISWKTVTRDPVAYKFDTIVYYRFYRFIRFFSDGHCLMSGIVDGDSTDEKSVVAQRMMEKILNNVGHRTYYNVENDTIVIDARDYRCSYLVYGLIQPESIHLIAQTRSEIWGTTIHYYDDVELYEFYQVALPEDTDW